MKIAIYSDTYPPQVNGVASFAEKTARALTERGHNVQVFSTNVIPSLPFWGYPGERILLPLGFSLPKVWKFKPDVIHTHTPLGIGWEAIYVSKLLRVPVVGTHHTFYDHYLRYVGMDYEFTKKMSWLYTVAYYNRCDFVMSPSRSLADFLIAHGLRRPTEIVPNCIDTDLFRPGENEKTGKTLVYMGRLGHEKSIDVVLRAFAILRKEFPGVELAIVGDGPERATLEGLARELGICDSVRFLGVKRGAELVHALQESDIFLTASASDNMPLSILEAMATGLPVVGANALGIPEIVRDGADGFLCAPFSPESMAEKTAILLRDPAMRKKFSESAHLAAQNYSRARVAENLENIYTKVIKKKK
jgi:1,2-diacylglycerol 3-alpha-glucosyltransferase